MAPESPSAVFLSEMLPVGMRVRNRGSWRRGIVEGYESETVQGALVSYVRVRPLMGGSQERWPANETEADR